MPVPGYSAWSVTSGEQPTTAYWNILGSNDAAFNTALTGSGTILTTAMSNPYKFSVTTNAGLSLTANTNTLVPLNTVNFDTGSNFNTTSNTFVAPIAGYYLFSWIGYINHSATNAYFNLPLYKNGSSIWSAVSFYGTGYVDSGGSALLKLAANDDIQLYAQDGMNVTLPAGSPQFTGFLVSES